MKELLDRIKSDHPQSTSLRSSAEKMLDVAERFRAEKATMTKSGKYTDTGLHSALREKLPGYAAQLEAAKVPLAKLKRETAQRRAAIKVNTPDPSNLAGVLERAEIRTFVRSMPAGERNALLACTRDMRILEALLTAPPELSGLAGPSMKQLAELVETTYFELTYGPEAKELDAIEEIVAAADAVAKIARNTLRQEVDLDERAFAALVGPAEKGAAAPWLLKHSGDPYVRVVEVGENGRATYRQATPYEIEVGIYYKDVAEWRAAQGEAAAA